MHPYRLPLLAALLISLCATDAWAQTDAQLWPELSTFVKLTPKARLYFLATTVKENRNSTSGEFGPNLDLYAKPLRGRKHFAGFKLDESKNQTLLIRIGYRYLPTYVSDDPAENRGVLEATARYPLVRGLLASSRNRVDLRFIDGTYSWRYRNRVSFEREMTLGKVTVNPYVRAEVFYDSRVKKWSRTGFMGGAALPVSRRFELEWYYQYELDTAGSSSRKTHAIGTVLNVYLR
jgi:hypothetical protein